MRGRLRRSEGWRDEGEVAEEGEGWRDEGEVAEELRLDG